MDEMTNNFGGSYGWLIIILLFFMIFGGNTSFGGRNTNQVERDVLTTSSNTDKLIEQTNYATLLGFKDAQAQMSQCCCDLKTTIHSESEATRALITQNRISDLQDQLAQEREALSNAVQTQNILGALGKYYTNPSINPYCAYNGYANAYNGYVNTLV